MFFRVTLPLATPGILSGTALSFARALGEFGATLMVAGNIPGRTQTIPLALFAAVESGRSFEANVLLAVTVALSFGLVAVVSIYERRGSGKRRMRERGKPGPATTLINFEKELPLFTLKAAFMLEKTMTAILWGESGAGKTTVLNCIAGLSDPDRGEILVEGKTVFSSTRRISLSPQERHVGFVFQSYALFPHLTAEENVALGMPRSERRHAVEYLERFPIARRRRSKPPFLSGGERQRLALARALATRPRSAPPG